MTIENDPVVPDNGQPVATAPVTDPNTNDGAPANQTPVDNSKGTKLKKDPTSELISQRDSNFQRALTAEERLEALEMANGKREFLDELCKQYPDVDRELLESAESPAQAEFLAKKFADITAKTKQKALEELTNVEEPPRFSAETKAEMLEAKKDSGDLAGAIGIMLN